MGSFFKRTSLEPQDILSESRRVVTPSAHDANVLCNINDEKDTIDEHNNNHNVINYYAGSW